MARKAKVKIDTPKSERQYYTVVVAGNYLKNDYETMTTDLSEAISYSKLDSLQRDCKMMLEPYGIEFSVKQFTVKWFDGEYITL